MDSLFSRSRTTVDETLDQIKKILAGSTDWTVGEPVFNDLSNVFDYLASIPSPSCILLYNGTSYGDETISSHSFSVVIVDADYGDNAKARIKAQGFADKAIGLLDFQMLNNTKTLITCVSQSILQFSNSTPHVGVKIDFKAEED